LFVNFDKDNHLFGIFFYLYTATNKNKQKQTKTNKNKQKQIKTNKNKTMKRANKMTRTHRMQSGVCQQCRRKLLASKHKKHTYRFIGGAGDESLTALEIPSLVKTQYDDNLSSNTYRQRRDESLDNYKQQRTKYARAAFNHCVNKHGFNNPQEINPCYERMNQKIAAKFPMAPDSNALAEIDSQNRRKVNQKIADRLRKEENVKVVGPSVWMPDNTQSPPRESTTPALFQSLSISSGAHSYTKKQRIS